MIDYYNYSKALWSDYQQGKITSDEFKSQIKRLKEEAGDAPDLRTQFTKPQPERKDLE